MRVDADHVIEHQSHAEALDAVLAQEHAELAGVEVIGVVRDRRVLGRRRLLRRLALHAQVRLEAHQVGERHVGVTLQPAGDEVRLRVALRQDERMEVVVAVAAVAPALEARALLEGGVALAEEIALGDADAAQRVAHGRPGAFADADRPDVGRFEQRDLQARVGSRAMVGGDDARGQPAGRPAADDHDMLDPIAPRRHCSLAIVTKKPLVGRRQRLCHRTRELRGSRRYCPNLYRAPIM